MVNKIAEHRRGTVFPTNLEYFMKEYQRTHEPQYFHKVLARLDLLMAKMIWQERKRYKSLQMVSNRDLYHTSIISMHEALLKFDFRKSNIYSFPRFLQGYIRSHMRPIIRQYDMLIPCGIVAAPFENVNRSCEIARRQKERLLRKHIISVAIAEMKSSTRIPKEHWGAFTMRHEEDRSYEEIAVTQGRSKEAVRKQTERLVKRIKRRVERSNKF